MAQGTTPRQRMINLMYLVLTAMLALQVSSTILDKFIFLNGSLEQALVAAKEASSNGLQALKDKVEKEGNNSKGLATVKRAEALRKTTNDLVSEIDRIKSQLIKETGGLDENGKLKNPAEEEKVAIFMLGAAGKNDGTAYQLEKQLNDYVDKLISEYADLGFKKRDFPSLAQGNLNNPLYKNDPIQRGKDFAKSSFEQTPVVAALAVLTQKQNEIVRYEQEILKKLGAAPDNLPKFDEVRAAATAESNTVAAGTEYMATMFLSATNSKADVKMSVNGSLLDVSNGEGAVRFIATGTGKQKWSGTISLRMPGSDRDTTFTIEKEYNVVRPTLVVNSETNFPLYKNCVNPLITSVPALGAAYNPSYSVKNGRAIPGGKVGSVSIVPTAEGKCVLRVTSDGKEVGESVFTVNTVPPPTIKPSIDITKPVPLVNSITLEVKPDEIFARTLPNEANYRINSVEVSQFRNGRLKLSKTFTGNVLNMRQFPDRQPGDSFQIKVIDVSRITVSAGIEQTKVTNPYSSFLTR